MSAGDDPAIYAELSPLPRHRGLVDHLFLLRDCGVLSAVGDSVFASPFREIRLARLDQARDWNLSDRPPRFHHRRRPRAFHGWMLGIRCRPALHTTPIVTPTSLCGGSTMPLTEAVERGVDLDRVVAALDTWIDTLPWWHAAMAARAGGGPVMAGGGRVAALASASGISARTLQRHARRSTGLGPKQWLVLLRFQQALLQVAQTREDLCEVAMALGYADQAHMNREFRRHAGTPPGRFRAVAEARLAENPVRFFQDAGLRGRLRLLLCPDRAASHEIIQAHSFSMLPQQPPKF